MPRYRVMLLLVLLLAGGVVPLRATADGDDPVALAKQHFQAGISLLKAENYTGAAVQFEESLEIYATPNALFNLANCYEALHRYDAALGAFERLLEEFGAELGDEMRASAERHLRDIRDLVAELTFEVEPDGATIAIDGQTIGTSPLEGPVFLGPGVFEIEVSCPEHVSETRQVKLVSRTTRLERFELEPVAAPAPEPPPVVEPPGLAPPPPAPDPEPPRRPSALFWTGLGLTAATAVTAGAFWGLTDREHEQFDELNAKVESGELPPEDPELKAAKDNGEMYQKLAIGLGATAGAFAIASTVILIVDLRTEDDAPVQVTAAPGGLGIVF